MRFLKLAFPLLLAAVVQLGSVISPALASGTDDLLVFNAADNNTEIKMIKDIFGCPLINEKSSCDQNLVHYYIFTPSNRSGQEVTVTANGTNIMETVYNPLFPMKMLIHGFDTNWQDVYIKDIREGYLSSSTPVNVLMIDYSSLVPFPCYIEAVHNIKYVGRCLAEAITVIRKEHMNATKGLDLELHIVGISLGGELPVYIADNLKGYLLPRVTGLDPAGPLFVFRNSASRLNPGVAKFVDVIHTNGLLQGSPIRLGHADFYMNGGLTQPGCYLLTSCDHQRAPQYFAESVKSTVGFYGFECSSIIEMITCNEYGKQPILMGEHCSNRTRGMFYVKTKNTKPFAKGKYF